MLAGGGGSEERAEPMTPISVSSAWSNGRAAKSMPNDLQIASGQVRYDRLRPNFIHNLVTVYHVEMRYRRLERDPELWSKQ